MTAGNSALVIGATGGVGRAIAQALIRHGWQVKALARDPGAAAAAWDDTHSPVWIPGDAMNERDVVKAAAGVSTIVHAANPPGYRNWDKLVLPMIANTITAARAAGGARVVLPGTIYNFDVAFTPVVDASTPQRAEGRKGRIRIQLEQMLDDAAPWVPSLILRAGDFFGPGARSSWFSQAMVKPGRPLRKITLLTSRPGHSWAYLPDLAEAFARILAKGDELAPIERLQFAGYVDESGTGIADAIERAARGKLVRSAFPWWLMRLLAPFGGMPREIAEIAPYWRHPLRLDNRQLVELIGAEPQTPLDIAIERTLTALGCIDGASTEKIAGSPAVTGTS